MKPTDFVHLHVHSDFSLLDGNCRVDDLVAQAKSLGMSHLGLTDHGNLFGVVKFYKAAIAAGITPVLGMEGYLASGNRKDRVKADSRKVNYHITLLAENNEGFSNLIKLSSAAYLEGFYYKPRMDKELLRKWGKGLICFSGCLSGEVIRKLRTEGRDAARATIEEYREIFGPDNFYLEIMHNGIEAQNEANDALIELSKETGVGLIATNDVHYVSQEDCNAQDIMLCIGTGKLQADDSRFKMASSDLYLRSGEEMSALFSHVPEAIENTHRVAERCNVEIDFTQRHLPAFESPDGKSSEEYFLELCREGVDRLYPAGGAEVEERLKYETDIIMSMGFVDYFLIVWDFIDYARKQGIPVGPGRGSAAGSIVSYALGITKIDPLQYDLLFERFLNAERISMPDIDIDFCKDGREQVIDYVNKKYGAENVAQIITFGTMAAKGVLRDVGRVLNIPLADVDTITKKIPAGPGVTLTKSLDQDAELREISQSTPQIRELFDVALRIEGCSRHTSVHAAGVVITDRPLTDRVPLYKNGDSITTQWTMDAIEELGMLKMDFLGLRTLTILDKACKNVMKTSGVEINLDELSLDDPDAYTLMANGDTSGIFQLESDGMRELLRKLKPDTFEDVIAVLALYRPGPLGASMDEAYWKRKHGLEDVTYLHECLEEILGESFGVILYQEQVMRIAAAMGSFTLNEADSLRKAMGKKKPEILARFKKQFVDGAATNGVAEASAEEIWAQIEYFAGYGFNKSHSAAYAMVTYQTAWMKAHHPTEYMASLLTCEMTSIDKTVEYVEAAGEMGIPLLPPDINRSYFEFSVEGASIRYALGAIRGVGQTAVDSLVAERVKIERDFTDVYDLCENVDTRALNKGAVEALVMAGALDELTGNRNQNLSVVEDALRLGQSTQGDKRTGQMSLFGAEDLKDETGNPALSLPDLPEFAEGDRLQKEKEALGFYLSGHPLDCHKATIARFATHEIGNLGRTIDKSEVVVGGIIRSVRTMLTKRGRDAGKRMAFVKFEDFTGSVDCVLFASVYGDMVEQITEDRILFLRGELDKSRGEPNIKVSGAISLEEAPQHLTRAVRLSLNRGDDFDMQIMTVKRLLKENSGRAQVSLTIATPSHGEVTVQAGSDLWVKLTPDVVSRLTDLLGATAIEIN